MVSKKQLKLIKSLHQKKYRNKHQLFFVEGVKTVNELLGSGIKPQLILSTPEKSTEVLYQDLVLLTENELKQISTLHTPSGVLGVFEMPEAGHIAYDTWVVALDSVQDPGNLGTIIRLCDWFGIQHLVCSHGTVDCYNPKTLQATMGSIARVAVRYVDLDIFLANQSLPVYGAFMGGASMYGQSLPKKGVLVLGNEANGISAQVADGITERIAIPQFGEQKTESLNVATATAILLAEIRRPS